MFTDPELELLEQIVEDCGEGWADTHVELRLIESIKAKIDKALNG